MTITKQQKVMYMPDYKFKEKDILNEVMDYIDNTYRQHYANGVEKQSPLKSLLIKVHNERFLHE